MAADKGMIAGAYYMQIAFRNSDGLPMGTQTAPNSVVNGTTTHAYKVKGFVEVTAPGVSYSVANRRAGQKLLGKKQLGLSELGTFDITLSDYDEQFRAYVTGGTVDTTTASANTITAPNSYLSVKPQFVLVLTLGFQNDSGTDEYINIFYPNVTFSDAFPSGNQGDGDNPNALTYTVTPSASSNTGFGFTFANSALAVQDNSDIQTVVRAAKPIALTTYVDDGSATSFTVGYKPTSSAVDGSTNMFTVDGADGSDDVSAFSTTTGATTHTAQTAGDVWVAAYYTDFVSL